MKPSKMKLELNPSQARALYEMLNGGKIRRESRRRLTWSFIDAIYCAWKTREVDKLLQPARRRLTEIQTKKTIDKASGQS